MRVNKGDYFVAQGARAVRIAVDQLPHKQRVVREKFVCKPFEASHCVRWNLRLLNEDYCRGAGEEGGQERQALSEPDGAYV
jgi:hypothetical protein